MTRSRWGRSTRVFCLRLDKERILALRVSLVVCKTTRKLQRVLGCSRVPCAALSFGPWSERCLEAGSLLFEAARLRGL